MKKHELSDSELFLQKGLATDIMWCEIHYFIFRSVGENSLVINEISNDHECQQLIYLQNTSQDLMLLSLSRIYDKNSTQYNVRCIEALIEECSISSSVHFPLEPEYYPSIKDISELSGISINAEQYMNQDDFIIFLKNILNSDKTKKSLKKIRTMRNKYIAHNEHFVMPTNFELFWEECSFLLDLSKLYLSIIGSIFFNSNYRMDEKVGKNKVDHTAFMQTTWLTDFLEKSIGKDKMIYWWKH